MRARSVVTALAGIAVAVAVLGGTTACSSTDSEAKPAASGTASGTSDDLAALCDRMVAESIPVAEAEALAETNGYVTRIGTLDGEPQAVTTDYREDRLTFDVTDGIVTGCTLG